MIGDAPDGVLRLAAGGLEVALRQEHCYSRNSTDNVRRYDREVVVSELGRSLGVEVREGESVLASMVLLGASMGGEARRCVLARPDSLLIAVTGEIAAFELPSLRLTWRAATHAGTIFALHEIPGENGLIVHGEITIARVSRDGRIEWERSGRDIFTGKLCIDDEVVEVTGWEADVYRFRLSDGEILAGPPLTSAPASPPPSPPLRWVDRVAGWFR